MKYSNGVINRAGEKLIDSTTPDAELLEAISLINDWRTLHFYPINTFQATLRKRIKNQKLECILVSQRLKRYKSIHRKLQSQGNMALSRMQDIGGLRAVFNNVEDVYSIYKHYLSNPLKHELKTPYDYIAHPKPSGYRSIHLPYQFSSPSLPDYDGLRVEIQLRSNLQHIWATSVETVGAFLNEPLKASQGPRPWLEFFKIVSSLFAIKEKQPVLEEHKNLSLKELMVAATKLSKKLKFVNQLKAFRVSADAIHKGKFKGKYFLIEINLVDRYVHIEPYKANELEKASHEYMEKENKSSKGQTEVVLVSAQSVKALKSAYPSYFLDTSEFIKKIETIERNTRRMLSGK